MKKRKQHYVWEHYLRAWADGEQIWCRRGDSVFRTNTENVAQSRDFYRLKEMSSTDLQFVKIAISSMNEPLRSLVEGWVPYFQDVFDIKRAWEASGQENPEVEKHLDIAINNIEEDIHESIEQKAIPLLAALRDGDASILDDDTQFIAFCRFIATQSLRTPTVAKRILRRSQGTIPGFDIEASWGLLRTIFSTSVGASLYGSRKRLRLVFLDAPAGAELVTGDQPVVNTRGPWDESGPPPTELEYYYPITPRRALQLDFDYVTVVRERKTLTEAEVEEYNRMIFLRSDRQIYASSEGALMSHTFPP